MIEYPTRERQIEALRNARADDPQTLRPAMRRLRLTIAEVARTAGIDYSRAEKLFNAKARPDEIVAIARALGIPPGSNAA